jgi:RNA polymerase sigma factor (sigma-70 family)
MTSDWQKLHRFRQDGDQEAFAEIVHQYIDLVWATGSRITGDADLARDLAQTVFADLARKADRLSEDTVLAGWLHRAVSFAARRALRDQSRRRSRERIAMELESLHAKAPAKDELDMLLPFVDEAIAKLEPKDRDAVILRFFGKLSLADLGAVLGIGEDAAQKRVQRALQRMRVYFRRRGLGASTALVVGVLGAAGSQAAPAGSAVAIAASSITIAGASSAALFGSSISHSLAALTTMKTSILTTAIVAGVIIAPIVYQEHEHAALQAAGADLAAKLQMSQGLGPGQLQNLQQELAQLRAGHQELAQLRAEAVALRTPELNRKLVLQDRLESARSALVAAQARTTRVQASIQAQDLALKRVDDMKKLGLAALLWSADNGHQLPTTLRALTDHLTNTDDFESFTAPYEFFDQGRPPEKGDPNLILFREKEPRPLPDGTWTRAYTMRDGSVQQVRSDTEDFSKWEHQHTATTDDISGAASNK